MATKNEQLRIISQVAPLCQKYSKQFGYKVCSPAIAQVLRESSGKYDGLSLLAYKYHNYHGLKCGDDWLKSGKPSVNMKTGEEYTVGTITNIKDNFRVFADMESGIRGYYEFLEYPRYRAVKTTSTPLEYLTALKAAGYCTSSTYIRNILKTGCMDYIEKYNLTQYDTVSPRLLPTLKKGDRNDYVRSWQNYLILQGYNLKSDGIFGDITEGIVKEWQKENGLQPTGIITPVEWNKIGVY